MIKEELDELDLRRGDIISVQWADIFEDAVGDPDTAELASRLSVGLYWDLKVSHDIHALVTTTTIDKDASKQNGYCIYPLECVLEVKVIKRTRKKGKQHGTVGHQRLEQVGEAGTGQTREE